MSDSGSARSEWRANWPLLLCCVIGISTPAISIFALGQFLGPLESEFGWTRTQATSGLSLSLVIGFLAAPVVGRLVDKVNARWLALPGLVLVAAAVAAFSLATENLAVWAGLWVFHSVVGALVGPTVWLAVISTAFDRGRSLAIAIALCGNNLATGFGPVISRLLLDAHGWRTSFQLLSLFWIGSALLLAFLFFFDRRDRTPPAPPMQGEIPRREIDVKEVFLSATFIRLVLAVAATTIAAGSYSIHLAPALASKGLSLAEAASLAGVAGLAAIPGKLGTGPLFDRFGSGKVAALVMALFGASCVLLALESDDMGRALLASAIFGLAAGANITLITVATSRVFSPAVFGLVYGTLTSLMALGSAIGPLAVSAIYDAHGSYAPAFWAGVPVAIVAAVLYQKLVPVGIEQERAA